MQTIDTNSLTLAQNGAIPLPGESSTATGGANGTAAPGGAVDGGTIAVPGGPGGGAKPAGGMSSQFMFITLGLVVVMFIVMSMGPRRERKKREAMINSVKKHDRVQTVGGVIGAIVELKPDFVVLKVDESANTRITFARSAIQQVLSSSDRPAEDDESSST